MSAIFRNKKRSIFQRRRMKLMPRKLGQEVFRLKKLKLKSKKRMRRMIIKRILLNLRNQLDQVENKFSKTMRTRKKKKLPRKTMIQ